MKIRKLLTAVLCLVFLVSASMLVLRQYDYKKGEQDYSDAMQTAGFEEQSASSGTSAAVSAPQQDEQDPEQVTEPEEETIPPEQQLAQIDLAALREMNEDVTGWIWIPGTNISYPILRAEDNDYYLTHTWKKERSAVGSIFLDYRTGEKDFNTLIYGHRMRNGSMFAELKYYNTIDKWNQCPDVYLLDDTGVALAHLCRLRGRYRCPGL